VIININHGSFYLAYSYRNESYKLEQMMKFKFFSTIIYGKLNKKPSEDLNLMMAFKYIIR
jgi:hypothetical protein